MADLRLEYYYDAGISSTHVEKHGVSEPELLEFFTEIAYLERHRKDDSRVAVGQLSSGRYLQVVYRKRNSGALFIITAYDLEDPELIRRANHLSI